MPTPECRQTFLVLVCLWVINKHIFSHYSLFNLEILYSRLIVDRTSAKFQRHIRVVRINFDVDIGAIERILLERGEQ